MLCEPLHSLIDPIAGRRRFVLKYPVVTKEICSLVLDIFDRRAAIRRRLQAIREIQAVYMPCVPQMVARHVLEAEAQAGIQKESPLPTQGTATRSTRRRLAAADLDPEKQPLFLPHSIAIEKLDGCVGGLSDIESRLREGQMHSALDSLRVQLHVRSRLLAFKAKNSRHQRENHRSQEQLESCQERIKVLAAKYRAARAAKLALCGPGDWEREYRILMDRDIRGLSEIEPQVDANNEPLSRHQCITEGRRVLSWIWLSADWDEDSEAAAAEGMNEGAYFICSMLRLY